MADIALTTTRRGLLGAFAAASIVGGPVVASSLRQTDAVPAAWEEFKVAHRLLCQNPDETPDDKLFEARMDAADDIIVDAVAYSPASVAMKLRRVFMGGIANAWAGNFAMGSDTAAHRRELDLCDFYERLLWSAIDDLERIAAN